MVLMLQMHKLFAPKHNVILIKDYLASSVSREIKSCDKHKSEILSIGCGVCLKVICTKCLSAIGACKNGMYLLCIFWSVKACIHSELTLIECRALFQRVYLVDNGKGPSKFLLSTTIPPGEKVVDNEMYPPATWTELVN